MASIIDSTRNKFKKVISISAIIAVCYFVISNVYPQFENLVFTIFESIFNVLREIFSTIGYIISSADYFPQVIMITGVIYFARCLFKVFGLFGGEVD